MFITSPKNLKSTCHFTKNFKVDAPEVPEEKPKDKDPALVELKVGRFSCGLCLKAFSRKGVAKRHYKNVHMSKDKNIPCRAPGCGKKFKSMAIMKIHMLTTHGISFQRK